MFRSEVKNIVDGFFDFVLIALPAFGSIIKSLVIIKVIIIIMIIINTIILLMRHQKQTPYHIPAPSEKEGMPSGRCWLTFEYGATSVVIQMLPPMTASWPMRTRPRIDALE